MSENIANMAKDINIQIQKAKQTPNNKGEKIKEIHAKAFIIKLIENNKSEKEP